MHKTHKVPQKILNKLFHLHKTHKVPQKILNKLFHFLMM